MVLIGIDPGASGGISILERGELATYKMPETETDIVDFFRQFDPNNTKAMIERLHGLPRMSSTAMFSFGRNYGTVRTALISLKIPFDDVPPKNWQKIFSISYQKKMSSSQKKNITKAKAQQLFPHIAVTHAIADSLLILEYLRRQELGQ